MKQRSYAIIISILTIFFIGCEEPESIKTPSTISSKNLMEFHLNGKVKFVLVTSQRIGKGGNTSSYSNSYSFNPSGFKTSDDLFNRKLNYNSDNDIKQEKHWNYGTKKWELYEIHHYTYDRYHRKIKDVIEHYSRKKRHKTALYSWNYENQIVTEKFKNYEGGFDHVTNYTYDTKGNVCSELYYLKGKLESQCYYKYDDLTNRLMQIKLISSNGVVVYTYVYNKKGHEINEIMRAVSFQNKESVEVNFPQISYGFNVGEYRTISKNVTTKLDRHGNWIYKKEDMDSVIYETKRKIIYYE